MYKRQLKKPDGRSLYLYSLSPISTEIVATNPQHEPFTPATHRRWHPLRGEWVIYATHRQNRTFLPPKEYSPLAVTKNSEFPTELPAGSYQIAVFENLFPSLTLNEISPPKFYIPTEKGLGHCEVVVFSQDSETSLSRLSEDNFLLVMKVLSERTKELGVLPDIKYVFPFENKGMEVGVTLHHPHGQIYAYGWVPPVVEKMLGLMNAHWLEKKSNLLADIISQEIKESSRVILESKHSVVFIPAFARYPYETWVLPKRSVAFLYELSEVELKDLAETLQKTLKKFDALWNKPFPYLMNLYQAPTDGVAHPEFHTHFEFFPPYRSRDKLKFLAGTELGAGMFVNDSVPEEKAKELREVKI